MNDSKNDATAKSANLSDRVRSLRLSDSGAPISVSRGRWWWIPWALCGVLFLASEFAGWITGQVLAIDGGK